MALNSQLKNQVHTYLLNSGCVNSDSSLRGLFVDARIAPWRNSIAEAGNRSLRATYVISEFDKMNNGYNVLALILQVISDRTPHGDSLKELGGNLAKQVQAGSTSSQRAEYERELAQLEEHYKAGWTDAAYYNRHKPELLALIAKFDAPQALPEDSTPPDGQAARRRLLDEFGISALALTQMQDAYRIYNEYGVDPGEIVDNITQAKRRCAELARKLRCH